MFYGYHTEFCNTIKDYYHASKLFYIERKFTYNSFINIVRQICKNNNAMFSSQIKYNDSEYNIDYFIYYWFVYHKKYNTTIYKCLAIKAHIIII